MEEKNLDFNIFYFLPPSIMFFGLKDLDKKDVFDYLICNRVFIDSLSDEEIKKYKKFFVAINRLRFKKKIFKFFKIL